MKAGSVISEQGSGGRGEGMRSLSSSYCSVKNSAENTRAIDAELLFARVGRNTAWHA